MLSSIYIDDLTASLDGEKATVIAIISADERINGKAVYSKYKVTYQINYENVQFKLIAGTGEKIE